MARLADFQPLRGVRYLYEQHGLLLYVPSFLPGDPVVVRHAGSISPGTSGGRPSPDCGPGGGIDLTIWIRLHGPEIIAGLAVPHPTEPCTWQFSYASGAGLPGLPPPGSYAVTVKAYGLSDSADVDISLCNSTANKVLTGTVLSAYEPFGTFYGEGPSCCEMCTRNPGCVQWTYTGFKGIGTKCILYESVEGERIAVEGEEGWPEGAELPTMADPNFSKYVSGVTRPKSLPVAYFLGCGFAAALEDAVCLAEGTDDTALMEPGAGTLVVKAKGEAPATNTLPRCGSEGNEAPASWGRWVRSNVEELGCPTVDSPRTPETKFHLTLHDPSLPEACWIHDTPSLLGKLCTGGCSRNPSSGVWTGGLLKEHFEYTWKPYGCDLPMHDDETIAACFAAGNYSRPEAKGDSVMEFFNEYLNLRLDAIEARPGFRFGSRPVKVSNFALTHKIWHKSEAEWLAASRTSLDVYPSEALKIWALGPFYSSERETKCTQGRAERFGALARPALVEERGWREADWRNVSMGLSFETATALDGMHVVGPSMKVLFHFIMNELCGES